MLTTVPDRPSPSPVPVRDVDRLLADLAVIAVQGWDSPRGTALLEFVRADLVRPLVAGTGLRGAAAAQAETTGWAAAWEAMAHPDLPAASSPWGVVWAAVRRAVLGEVLTARYHVSPRKAWALRANPPDGGTTPPAGTCGWDDLTEAEHPSALDAGPVVARVRTALAAAREALVSAGWEPDVAAELVAQILADPAPGQGESIAKPGWRALAAETGLPPWQVRRVSVVLLGAPGWVGLLERLLRPAAGGHADVDDDGVLDAPMRAALRSTRVRSRRSPALEAARTAAAAHTGPARAGLRRAS